MNTTAINHDDVAAVVRLPRHLYQALRVRAAAEDRTVAALIRIAASEHVGVLLTVSGTLTTPATPTVTTDGMTVGQTVVVTDADGDAS